MKTIRSPQGVQEGQFGCTRCQVCDQNAFQDCPGVPRLAFLARVSAVLTQQGSGAGYICFSFVPAVRLILSSLTHSWKYPFAFGNPDDFA